MCTRGRHTDTGTWPHTPTGEPHLTHPVARAVDKVWRGVLPQHAEALARLLPARDALRVSKQSEAVADRLPRYDVSELIVVQTKKTVPVYPVLLERVRVLSAATLSQPRAHLRCAPVLHVRSVELGVVVLLMQLLKSHVHGAVAVLLPMPARLWSRTSDFLLLWRLDALLGPARAL